VIVVKLLFANCLTGWIAAVIVSTCVGGEVDFSRDIRPILSNTCFHCHGPDANTREADLRLDQREGLFSSPSGVAIVTPGKPEASELLRRITANDPDEHMPPAESNLSLSADEIAKIRQWIEEGASYKQHWAFEAPLAKAPPVIDPAVALLLKNQPKLKPQADRLAAWPRNPIDHFVLSRLATEGMAPAEAADKLRLLRRVTLDLTGLPPTIEQIEAFHADQSPGAYERVVDRLLASQHYGERMAWNWLDAARYADSNGFQGDPERTMWPWRDWVVDAMNNNMPFDQFTIEQLAGDLLPEATVPQRIATGFNRNHMHNGEGGRIAEETRIENVIDRAEATATVWLGMTLTCCRCHDHKFDPLSQQEYYEFFAFFNNTSENGSGRGGQLAPAIDAPTTEQSARLKKLQQQASQSAGEATEQEKAFPPFVGVEAEEPPEPPPAEGYKGPLVPQAIVAILAKKPGARSSAEIKQLADHFRPSSAAYAQILMRQKQAIDEIARIKKSIPRVMIMDDLPKPRDTFMLTRGAYDKPGEKVTAGVPTVFPPLSAESTANRLVLANWLVDPAHPLTARVTVNRYWQTFFGVGLVKTSEDFGVQGERPSHPDLLDYLATDFIASGWDVKAMHKQIVMSATYRQSARTTPEQSEADPENRLLGRGPRFRMPSWMIRDHALAASGLLVEELGGPSVKPYQPGGVWAEATFGRKKYVQDHGDALYRRSLYTFWRRIVGPAMFFDAAKRQTCSVNVSRTNTPLHALAVLNDITYVEAARTLAQRVLQEKETTEHRLAMAFQLAVSRSPTKAETAILTQRYNALHQQYQEAPAEAAKLLGVGESKRDETLDPIDHAAYLGVCMLLFNLDEALNK